MTQTEVRSRIRRHRHSFKCECKKHETALSNFIWDKELNRNGDDEFTESDMKWSILKQCNLYKPGQKKPVIYSYQKKYAYTCNSKPKTPQVH